MIWIAKIILVVGVTAYGDTRMSRRKGVRAGEALVMLREMLGHSTITTTLRYLGTDAAVVAELMKELR